MQPWNSSRPQNGSRSSTDTLFCKDSQELVCRLQFQIMPSWVMSTTNTVLGFSIKALLCLRDTTRDLGLVYGLDLMVTDMYAVHTCTRSFSLFPHALGMSLLIDQLLFLGKNWILVTHARVLLNWLQTFSVESVIQKCNSSIPLLSCEKWPSCPPEYLSHLLTVVTVTNT